MPHKKSIHQEPHYRRYYREHRKERLAYARRRRQRETNSIVNPTSIVQGPRRTRLAVTASTLMSLPPEQLARMITRITVERKVDLVPVGPRK